MSATTGEAILAALQDWANSTDNSPYTGNTSGTTYDGILSVVSDIVTSADSSPYAQNTSGTTLDGILAVLKDIKASADHSPYARNTDGTTALDAILDTLIDIKGSSNNGPYASNTSGTTLDGWLTVLASKVGGGGGGYAAPAVQFNGRTWLRNDALAAIDSSVFSEVVWVKFSGVFLDQQSSANLYITDAENNFTDETYFVDDGTLTTWLVGASGSPDTSLAINTTTIPNNTWGCIITSGDVGHAQGSKRGKTYLGDTDITASLQDTGASFTFAYNGKSMNIGTDTFNGLIAAVSDHYIMPNVSLLDGGGDIPLATRRIFMDDAGKPKSPADVIAGLGVTPCVALSGDSSSYGNNSLGSGGSFSRVTSFTRVTNGSAGAGPVFINAVFAGDAVISVHNDTSNTDVSADFETTISATNNIQQIGSADYSADTLTVTIALDGALTDATTSPSD